MFGISFEHIIIVGVILLLVGPRRLPELGNTMGKAIKNFKDSMSGVEEASFKRVPNNEDVPKVSTQADTSYTHKTAANTPNANSPSPERSHETQV